MKKIKFLNGISAIFAFAAVALATTFTSCEKESFEVKVDPINAKATIKPIVLAVENGAVKDVTSAAQVTISPKSEFEGNPSLAAADATIKVTYKDFEPVEVKVSVPALQAGQFAALTPTIILQKEETPTKIVVDPKTTTTEQGEEGHMDNTSDYWWYTTAKYTEKTGSQKGAENIITTDLTEIAIVKAYFSGIEETYKTKEIELKDVEVFAHSRTIVKIQYTVVSTDYKIYNRAQTRAADVLLASMTVKNYTTTLVDILRNEPIPGHNHAPQGHGHGHGHGGDNAGGGIVLPD